VRYAGPGHLADATIAHNLRSARPRTLSPSWTIGRDLDKSSATVRPLRTRTLVFVLLAVVACAAPVVSLQPTTSSFTPDDYDEVYDRWTRAGDPFNFGALRSVLHATATFESREFRWAYVVRYAEDYGLAPDARNAMLKATMADADQHHRFFVTVGGGGGRFRDVDLTDERGGWRVLLLDDRGRQVRPLEIQNLRQGTTTERVYFPGLPPTRIPGSAAYRTAFRLVFPVRHEDGYPTIAPEALFAILRFTGPEGQLDLKWTFAHP
jgi:hypothetical protein